MTQLTTMVTNSAATEIAARLMCALRAGTRRKTAGCIAVGAGEVSDLMSTGESGSDDRMCLRALFRIGRE